jgi:hypothetical protein
MTHIHKAHSRLISYLGLITIAVFGIVSTLGSGGGGGDGDGGPQPLTYSGNTNPAAITLTNAPSLVGNVLYGGITSSNVPIPTAASTSPGEVQSGSVAAVSTHLLTILHYSLDDLIGSTVTGYSLPVAVAVPIDETIPCESGYYTIEGTIDDTTFTGTLNFNYVNCVNEGVTFNGSGTFRIDMLIPDLDVTMSFTLMTISSAEFNGSISGTMRLEASLSGNTETDRMTMNYVAEDNNTGKMYKFENLIMTMVIDDITVLNSSGSTTFTGSPARVYDSDYGYVIIDTLSQLLYSDITLIYPDNGGVMIFTGDNSSIQLTVMSGRHVRLDLDIDGIAGYEVVRYLLWEELAANANTDLTDTDGDGMHDSWESMFVGLDPNIPDADGNPDGDGLTNLQEYQQGYDPSDPGSP